MRKTLRRRRRCCGAAPCRYLGATLCIHERRRRNQWLPTDWNAIRTADRRPVPKSAGARQRPAARGVLVAALVRHADEHSENLCSGQIVDIRILWGRTRHLWISQSGL